MQWGPHKTLENRDIVRKKTKGPRTRRTASAWAERNSSRTGRPRGNPHGGGGGGGCGFLGRGRSIKDGISSPSRKMALSLSSLLPHRHFQLIKLPAGLLLASARSRAPLRRRRRGEPSRHAASCAASSATWPRPGPPRASSAPAAAGSHADAGRCFQSRVFL